MAAEASLLHRLFGLDGKVALITGAGGGIGQALARGLAGAGATVVLHARTLDKLAGLQEEITAAGGRAVALTAELSDRAAARRLVADAYAACGRLDILINCAGANRRKPISQVTEEDWEYIMAVNLRSLYFISQAVHPLMRQQGGGKIVHIGSINSHFALGSVSVYGASKGAVAQLTKVMAVEWAKDNIQVNCLIPGFVRTPLTQVIWDDPYKAAWLRARIPMRRPAEPEEMVAPVLLLVGPGSSHITGTTLIVDGGVLAGGWWEPDEAVRDL